MKTGEIRLSQDRWLEFSVEEFRGDVYASIRLHMSIPGYLGPTRKGIILKKNVFFTIYDAIRDLKKEDINNYGDLGLGLELMRRRTRLIGGRLKIETQTGLGTVVRVTVPVK